jgi:hypothetical protein
VHWVVRVPGHGVVPLPPEGVGIATCLLDGETLVVRGLGEVRVRPLHQAVAEGVGDHLGTVLHVQFVEDVAQVVLDRVLADEEALSQLSIRGDPLDQKLEHFALPRRQGVGGLWRWAGLWASERAEDLPRQARRERRLASGDPFQ